MALQRVINTPARGIGKTTLETVRKPGSRNRPVHLGRDRRGHRQALIPARALAALESFRQLILDAQATMDPDFAGKLSADVAESANADTGFNFGEVAPEEPTGANSNISFDFGDALPSQTTNTGGAPGLDS